MSFLTQIDDNHSNGFAATYRIDVEPSEDNASLELSNPNFLLGVLVGGSLVLGVYSSVRFNKLGRLFLRKDDVLFSSRMYKSKPSPREFSSKNNLPVFGVECHCPIHL